MDEQLSTEQLLLLNNLMYMTDTKPLRNIADTKATTVAKFINNINVEALEVSKDYGSLITGEEWKNIIQAVKNDEQLMNMQIAEVHVDSVKDGGGGGVSAVFVDPSTNEAVVTFRGTALKEWHDNFVGGGLTKANDKVSTPFQQNALDWYQSLDLEKYDTVTVTGHSKGGNKAKYITLLDDSVDRCVSFDGQGFSDAFMMKYMAEISANQDKITNHNVEGDYVNPLLNDVGKTTFYKGYDIGEGGFLENHCPNTFFKFGENGSFELVEGTRDENMAVLDEFLNCYLRSMSAEDRQESLDMIGELAQGGFNGAGINEYLDIMLKSDNVDHAAYFLAYTVEYQQENPELIGALNDVLAKNGGEPLINLVNGVVDFVNSEDFDDMFETVGFAADLLPEFAYGIAGDKLEDELGIDLSGKELKKLFGMIGTASDEMENIEIKDNGVDITIPSELPEITFNDELRIRPGLRLNPSFQGKPKFRFEPESLLGTDEPLILDDPIILDEPQLRLFPDEIDAFEPETKRAKLGRDFERC